MKNRILLVCLLIALVSIVSAGTFAFFTAETTTNNAVTTASLTFEIHEHTADGGEYPAAPLTVMPGDRVQKTVTIENTGTRPMYLRVKITPATDDPALSAAGCILPAINTADWVAYGDYYYYKTALQAGDFTAPLFTEIHFPGDAITNAYLGRQFTLDVAVDAVQSDHNGTAPTEAAGWPNE